MAFRLFLPLSLPLSIQYNIREYIRINIGKETKETAYRNNMRKMGRVGMDSPI
jgi:hypothetical protein